MSRYGICECCKETGCSGDSCYGKDKDYLKLVSAFDKCETVQDVVEVCKKEFSDNADLRLFLKRDVGLDAIKEIMGKVRSSSMWNELMNEKQMDAMENYLRSDGAANAAAKAAVYRSKWDYADKNIDDGPEFMSVREFITRIMRCFGYF